MFTPILIYNNINNNAFEFSFYADFKQFTKSI